MEQNDKLKTLANLLKRPKPTQQDIINLLAIAFQLGLETANVNQNPKPA